MGANPIFELFEIICAELVFQPTQILSEDDIGDDLLNDVMDHFEETSKSSAFRRALADLQAHFIERGASLPFTVDHPTGQFKAVDIDYIDFVAFAKNHRGVGGEDSKNFEIRIANRLRVRLTGDLRRVGAPRDRMKKRAEIVKYLEGLGFDKNCIENDDKDGGLDILWLPPLGAVPLRPVVSLQCKNSFFDEEAANASTGRATRTLRRHSHHRGDYLKFVIFNDYIDRSRFSGRAAGWSFLPLGLTDLAAPDGSDILDVL